jgi:hypothetical protein
VPGKASADEHFPLLVEQFPGARRALLLSANQNEGKTGMDRPIFFFA